LHLPIVSVDVGDVTDQVRGVEPTYITESNPKALANAIVQVFTGERRRSNGHAKAAEFSNSTLAPKIIALYRRCILQNRQILALICKGLTA